MFFLHKKSTLFFVALLLFYVVSVAVNFGKLELAGEEPRRAVISIEMFESGNFFKPTLLGWDYYNKPPVFNWVQAAMIQLTGSASEAVLRLPSLLFYLLMAYFLYCVNRHFFPKRTAVLSAFFLLTCGDVYFYGLANGAEIDVFYSFLVYLQVISIFWFFTKKQFLSLFLWSYFFCAVGFLTKGFPSLVFQILTFAALGVFAKSIRPLFRWQHLAGLLLFLLLTGSFFYLYSRHNSPQRLLVNLLNESLIKSAIGERSNKLLDKSIAFPLLFLKLLLPWSLLLLLLFKKIKYQFLQNPVVRFSLLFVLLNLWVYWFTGQPKGRYIYMFLPFACTILTQVYQRFTEAYPAFFDKVLRYFSAIFFLAFIAILALPFLAEVSVAWTVSLAMALALFLVFYLKTSVNRIWQLVGGILLLRLAYAVLLIPIQYREIPNYQRQVAVAAKATRQRPVQYLSNPVPFSVSLNTQLFEYQMETIQVPPVTSFQIPYYYYKLTGKLLSYDTIPRANVSLFSMASQMNEKPVDTLHVFFDQNMFDRAVFYRFR